jgi:hypothetical protein
MASISSPSPADIAAALGLPEPLLDLLRQVFKCRPAQFMSLTTFQIGVDVNDMVQNAEHVYIEQLTDYTQALPVKIQRPVDVRCSSSFAAFLDNAALSHFMKHVLASAVRFVSTSQ